MPARQWVNVHRDERGVATVMVDNAAKLNVLNPPVMNALIEAMQRLAGDAGLRAVVLRGAGERAFIGGADINAMAALDAGSARAFITLVHQTCDVFRTLSVPAIACIQAALLPGLIGWGRTRRLLLTGETIDAATALAWGLVEEVAPPEALDASVARVVDGILASGPRAVRLQKALIQDWEGLSVDAAIQHGIDCFVDAWHSDEPRRMMNAFVQRQRQRSG